MARDILWTDTEIMTILADCVEIDDQVTAIVARVAETGSPVPLRPLGIWERMRLDQRNIIRQALAV